MKQFKIACIIAAVIIAAAWLASCAHDRPCPSAEDVMSHEGLVLNCQRITYQDTGEQADACTILLPNGVVREQTVFKRHCGL